jgi:glycosyltransferase 2 family protein
MAPAGRRSPSLGTVWTRWRAFFAAHTAKLGASLLVTCGLVYTIHKGGLKLVPEGGDFDAVRWWTIPLYILFFVALTWFRSVRWRFLLRPIADVPRRRLFVVSLIGFTAILVMPFRIGEFVRPYLIRTPTSEMAPGKPSITMTTATSSIIAERIIDGLYLSIVLAVALVFVPTVHPLPHRVVGLGISVEQVRMYGYAVLGLFGALFATIAVFYFARSWAHQKTMTVIGKVSHKLAAKLAGTFEKLADGLHVFGHGESALGFFAETTLYWGLSALGLWLLAWGCGVAHADGSAGTFGESCALLGMLGCSVMLPGPPGLLGVFQAGLYAGMTMYYPTTIVVGAGAAFVFVMYASQVLSQLAMTVWALSSIGGSRGLRAGLEALEDAEDLASVR